jgi:selenocysteine-specific elongation factor
MHVVATAGHVDHGKSTLVRALTGTDPDRLAEEKRRGMTIDLGFAWAEVDGIGWVAFVDVPGHTDYLHNMIAGVAVVAAGLLVVDATEGWRTQTYEHLQVLDLAGVHCLLVVLTKAGAVPGDQVEDLVASSRAWLEATRFSGAAVVACDAVSGSGLDSVRCGLRRMLDPPSPQVDRGRPRLWIDRSFTISGSGTVVTGGLAHGSIHQDESVSVVTSRGLVGTRIRRLEALGQRIERADPGSRVAVNLARVPATRVRRGDAVVRGGDWHLTECVDVELHASAGLRWPVTRRGAFVAHVGSGAHPTRLRVLGASQIPAGETGHVRLHLPHPLPLLPGDHYVLTDSGPRTLVGGGRILDVDPILPTTRAAPSMSVERVVTERGWTLVEDLERLTGQRRSANVGSWVVDPALLDEDIVDMLERLTAAGPAGVSLAALTNRQAALVELLVADGRCRVSSGVAHVAGSDVVHPYVARLLVDPFRPVQPRDFGIAADELAQLRRSGEITTVDGTTYASWAIDRALALMSELLDTHHEGVSVSDFRTALETSRRWVMPLLEHFDAIGATRRHGDHRVEGPRLRQLLNRSRPASTEENR